MSGSTWCRYHDGYVPLEQTKELLTGRGRVKARICLDCLAYRKMKPEDREARSREQVKIRKAKASAALRSIAEYKNKIGDKER
jgi:hypothetical protein